MPSNQYPTSEIASQAVGLTAPEMIVLLDAKQREIIRLRCQVAWFQRQIFGQKSERQMPEPDSVQGTLGEAFNVVPDDVELTKKTRIAAHEREPKNKNTNPIDGNDGAALFFDEPKVPVEVIAVANDEAEGLDPTNFEVIGEKVSYRLAQRPGSYVILKYVRPLIKLRTDQVLPCPPALVGVLDGCLTMQGDTAAYTACRTAQLKQTAPSSSAEGSGFLHYLLSTHSSKQFLTYSG